MLITKQTAYMARTNFRLSQNLTVCVFHYVYQILTMFLFYYSGLILPKNVRTLLFKSSLHTIRAQISLALALKYIGVTVTKLRLMHVSFN